MDLKTVKANKILDARSMPCPQPIHETQNAIALLTMNDILEIRVADRGTKTDLRLWCAEKDQEFLGYIERDGYDSVFIRKII